MAMKNLANCAKALERAQQTRQFGVSTGSNRNDAIKMQLNKLHVTAQKSYPVAAALPLPANIDPSESTRFSPQRNRDICAHAILTHQQSSVDLEKPLDVTVDSSSAWTDPHVESYDCSGAVSLNSSMQSNVPSPFGGMHKFTHLNMPGGQWSQDSKFMSHNLQSSHYTNLRQEARVGWSDYDENATATLNKKGMHGQPSIRMLFYKSEILNRSNQVCSLHELTRKFSTGIVHNTKTAAETKTVGEKSTIESVAEQQVNVKTEEENMSRKDKLKRAFKEYGATVVIFHVGISLMSLGACYLLVSRGIDVVPFIEKLGLGSSLSITAGASTFVIAYAVHKVFAPVRISITLGATPLIVRYFRIKRKSDIKKN